jgi:synaptobrevin family protein YKT6
MKITAIAVYRHLGTEAVPVQLGIAVDVANFGYFQRGSVREMINFISRTIVQRTQPGLRQTVRQDDYYCHVHVRDNGLAGVVVADKDYPTTAAFSIIAKSLEEYGAAHGESWAAATEDGAAGNEALELALTRYQDPAAADKIAKIQRDLDETKIILHQTIDSVLRRGEKLDALVDKSADLSMASQMFYKQARKTNSCCSFM